MSGLKKAKDEGTFARNLAFRKAKDECNRTLDRAYQAIEDKDILTFNQAYQKALCDMKSLASSLDKENEMIRRPQIDGFTQTESSLPTKSVKIMEPAQFEGQDIDNNNDTSAHDEIAVLGTSLVKSPEVKFGRARRSSNTTNVKSVEFENDISPGFKQTLLKKREEMLSQIKSDHGTALVETCCGTQSDSLTWDYYEFLRDDGRVNHDFTKMVEPICEISPPEKSAPEPIIEESPTDAVNTTQTRARVMAASTSKTGYPDSLSPELKQYRDQKIREIRSIGGFFGTESIDASTSPPPRVEGGAQSRPDERSHEPSVTDKSPSKVCPEAGTVKRIASTEDHVVATSVPAPFDIRTLPTKKQSASDAGAETSPAKIPREECGQRVRQSVRVTADPLIKAGILPPDFGQTKQVSAPVTSDADEARYNLLWETKQCIGNGALTVRKLKPSVLGTQMSTGKFIDHIQEFHRLYRDGQM